MITTKPVFDFDLIVSEKVGKYIDKLEKAYGKCEIDEDIHTEEDVALWQYCHTKHYHEGEEQ